MSADIVFLGTASQAPSKTRNVSSCAVRMPSGSVWMVDCGEGTQHQIGRQNAVKLSKLDAVFITHLHGDHTFGIPGMLCTTSSRTDVDAKRVVHVVGPKNTAAYIRSALEYSSSFLAFQLHVTELVSAEEADSTAATKMVKPKKSKAKKIVSGAGGDGAVDSEEEGGGLDIKVVRLGPTTDGSGNDVWHCLSSPEGEVHAARVTHSVTCFGFSFKLPDTPGKINMRHIKPILDENREALKTQGVPKAEMLLRDLKAGKVLEMPDGRKIDPSDEAVISLPSKGLHFVLLGDTSDSSQCAGIAQGCDVLVHEATNAFLESEDEGTTPEEVEEKTKSHGHSTPQMAGRFAREVGAGLLALTHFSARYLGDPSEESLAIMRHIAAAAASQMGREGEVSVEAEGYAASQNVVCACDMMTISCSSKTRAVSVDPAGATK